MFPYDTLLEYPIRFNTVLSIVLGTVSPTAETGGTILNYTASVHGVTGSGYRAMYTVSMSTNRNPIGYHLTVGM